MTEFSIIAFETKFEKNHPTDGFFTDCNLKLKNTANLLTKYVNS
jgi:hypothetical protein